MTDTPLELHMPEGEAPPKSYVPGGLKDVDEYLADAREQYRLDIEADKENRDAALDDLKFASGEQWDKKVLEYRKNKPCLTINTIPQFVGQVIGDWRINRPSIKVLPSEDGDVDVATIRGDLIRNIEVQSRADRVYTNAFESMVTCGIGNFEVCTQYASDEVFDQDIAIKAIANPLAVIWDRMSIDPTGRDADHCFVDDVIPRKLFEKKWPNAQPAEIAPELEAELRTEGWATEDTIRITAHWRMITKERRLALLVDGSVQDITGQDVPPEAILKERMVDRRYAQRHLITGLAILEGPYELPVKRLPVIRMSGREVMVGEKRVRFGLVRFLKDPARLNNFWRSTRAENLGYASKIKYRATASAVEGREQTWRTAHLSDDPLLISNDGHPMPERDDPPQLQAALFAESEANAKDMQDVTGIHEAGLGMRSNETSGKAINARQREGDVATIMYHDGGNAAVLEAGDVANSLIDQIYDATRTVRILGEDGEARMQKINDPMDPEAVDLGKGSYDVTMSTGASYTTRRVEAQEAMAQFVQADPTLMQKAGDLIMKVQDVAGAEEIAERLAKFLPPEITQEDDEQGIPPQVQQAMAQMSEQMQMAQQALEQLQAENAALQQDRAVELGKLALDERKVEIEAYKAQTDRLTAEASAAAQVMTAQQPQQPLQ